MRLYKKQGFDLLFALIAFPCLGSWLLLRLWVPLGGRIPGLGLGILSLGLSAFLLFLILRFSWIDHFLLPFRSRKALLVIGLSAFLLGSYFDISYSMLDTSGMLIAHPLFRILCHIGNGMVFSGIILTLFCMTKDLRGIGRVNWRQLVLLFVLLNFVTALYSFTSKTVYIWDNAGYWSVSRKLAAENLAPFQIRTILETTLTLDYNHLLAFPISLVMRIFGGSRAVFLFAISNLYTLPGLWGLCALSRDKKWGGLFLSGLFPMLVYIGLVGFVDVAACSLGIWAYVVYTSNRPAISRGVVSGALLVGTFLLRRYFFFFAVSFGIAALCIKLLLDRKNWSDFFSLFVSCGVCSLTFTYSFLLEKVLGNHYRDLYSAYALGLKSDLVLFSRYFGLALFLLFGGLSLLRLRRHEYRAHIIFGLVQPLICFVAFVLVQSHGQQHCLMYLPALAFLASTLFPTLSRLFSFLLAAGISINCFIPKVQPASLNEISFPDLFPSFHFYGPKRNDIDQLLALSECIDALSEKEPHSAVVLASSLLLNNETLPNLYPSLSLPEPPRRTLLLDHGSVDKRDGFNWSTAAADYLIVGDPVQVHLGEENQQIVALLAHHVLEGTGPGTAYTPLPETFVLSDGSIVRIYERQRDWTEAELQAISDSLIAAYPDYAWLYQAPTGSK